jgi:uncharacterized protein
MSSASIHRFDTTYGKHLFVADGSRIYDLDPELDQALDSAVAAGDDALDALLDRIGLGTTPCIDDAPLRDPPLRALSLAVAQKCNLGCTYCYAQGGEFGAPSRSMDWPVARDAILRLLEGVKPGERANVAYLGGEPLINRELVRKTTEFAAELASERGVSIHFSITSNGTLLRPDDAVFFERHGFAVTISIDGLADTHDRLRPFRGGGGSYRRTIERVRPLLDLQHHMQVSARATVTPLNLSLLETLDSLVDLGFHSVGFAPMLSAPAPGLELGAQDLDTMLAQMIACADKFAEQTVAGIRYPFSNMAEALHQIHRGTHRPYPCGAGAGYVGVSASGDLYACHRFVEDPQGHLGDVAGGVDRARQRIWLQERHVHRQSPCTTCWARYLCGGGCHHEVLNRGRPACDFIRGWLHHCLQVYATLTERRPDFFAAAGA